MMLRARVDMNHRAIVAALRDAGCSVQSLAAIGKGCPDLLVGYADRNWLLEVKNPLARIQKLTPDENRWHNDWRGQKAIVRTAWEALRLIGAMR